MRNGTTSTFSYDANGQRYKQVKQQGSSVTTTYYVGSFEREVSSSATIDKTYIGDHTIKMKAHVGSLGNQSPFQHVLRDHLGSVDTLIDGQTGAVLQYRGYDVFGRPRDIAAGNALLTAWQGVTKGYTDHEHLNEQQLIHMNGRIYDFNVGRFLSVDPFLQFPENSQSANPYSYILNNPMSGVDPTGYSAIRSGNASNWRVPMCDSNYGNTCAKTPVDNIMAQWGLSNGQSNESLAKQGQLKRQQIREERKSIGLQEGGDDGDSNFLPKNCQDCRYLHGALPMPGLPIPIFPAKTPEQIAKDKVLADKLETAVREKIEDLRRPSSKSLEKTLTDAGYEKPGEGWEAHHIVFWGHSHADAQAARDALSEVDIDINSADNLVWLPANDRVKASYGSIAVAHHGDGLHSYKAISAINSRVQMGVDKDHTRAILNGIRSELSNGNKFWEK